jgi:ATP-dependent DNA helicase DinG
VETSFSEIARFFRDSTGIPSPARAEAKIRFTDELRRQPQWQSLVLVTVAQLIGEIKNFHRLLLHLEKALQALEEDVTGPLFPLLVELKALTDRVETSASTLGEIFGEPDDKKVRWVEIRQGKSSPLITLKQAPLSVDELLHEKVFNRFATIILSSATLTTNRHFEYIKSRLGLQHLPPEKLIEVLLPSSFNYSDQVILGIPKDVPSPDHPDFARELTELVKRSIEISEGRALVLFTSYSLLLRLFKELQAPLEAEGFQALMQGQAPRHRLLEIFRGDTTSVLFATDSFWEGVDVVGESLENVILTKLPFSVPKEPVIEARVEALERAGKNSFLEYSVPQAVIKFKQGFGRLIRSREDFGSIMIFDRRILEKSYGRVFLESLPDCQLVSGEREVVFGKVSEFFLNRRKARRAAKKK